MSKGKKIKAKAKDAKQLLQAVMGTHVWSSGSVVVRGMLLRSEALDLRIHPEDVPLHRFVAECQDTRRRFSEIWRLDQPPSVEPFARRAQRALMSANRRTRVHNAKAKSTLSRREDVFGERVYIPDLVDSSESSLM